MNQLLLVVLLALVAAGSCGKSPSGHGKPATLTQRARCNAVFTPTAAEAKTLRNATIKCVASLGLQTTIAGLGDDSGEDSREDTRKGGHGGNSGEGHDDHDVASVLEAYGYLANATALRKCIATELGMVAANGTYDMAALKTLIQGKVAALSIKANTQLGLDNCPAVVDFDVVKYLKCVQTYCVTGAAPKTG